MKSTFSILFYIDRSKTNENNECIIRCRITCNGTSASFSTGLHTFPDDWQSKIGHFNSANGLVLYLDTFSLGMRPSIPCSGVCAPDGQV